MHTNIPVLFTFCSDSFDPNRDEGCSKFGRELDERFKKKQKKNQGGGFGTLFPMVANNYQSHLDHFF